jgi:SAM-dependent methyltransferase
MPTRLSNSRMDPGCGRTRGRSSPRSRRSPAVGRSGSGIRSGTRASPSGETVVDLGCGAGLDVLLAAREVGPSGRVVGIDLLDRCWTAHTAAAAEAGLTHTEFLRSEMEAVPLPDGSVDAVISNGSFNLSARKSRVMAEAHRLLQTRRSVVRLRPDGVGERTTAGDPHPSVGLGGLSIRRPGGACLRQETGERRIRTDRGGGADFIRHRRRRSLSPLHAGGDRADA